MNLCDGQGYPGALPPLRKRPDRLGLRVPLHRDEPMAGYLARLAARAGHGTLEDCFSLSLPGKFSVRHALDGKRQDDVCALFDLPSCAFHAATPRRVPGGKWALGDESNLPEGFISFEALRACPRCLAVDEAHGAGPQQRVEPHIRTFWMFPLVRACPIHGLRLIDVPGGPEGFALMERNMRRRPWDSVAVEAASEVEIGLSRFIAGHFGFVAPLPLPESGVWASPTGLPRMLTAAALIGFALDDDPAPAPSGEDWRAWMGVGLARLLDGDGSWPRLAEFIAARFPKLRPSFPRQGEFAFLNSAVVDPMTMLRDVGCALPQLPEDCAFGDLRALGAPGGRGAPALVFAGLCEPVVIGAKAINSLFGPNTANELRYLELQGVRLPPRFTRRGVAKPVAPLNLLLGPGRGSPSLLPQ